ncbi:glycosyltransferase family 25 protein [Psychroflexus tropicus]|uniref:glycosyltransferase family 25 protein n=1 Tax=Psychroflexus tropicus TaxID=197345 RepID=UPI0003A6C01C|nr:glycosyltransferase family 25 protein [Psychroflexus tropicus]
MVSFKIYFINLDRSQERRSFMESQLSKFDVNFERFTAVDGKSLDSRFIYKAKGQHKLIKHFPSLNFGEIGLIKSYFDLFEIISKQKEDYAIIFEDDVKIEHSFFDEIHDILKSITTNDFVDISGKKGFSLIIENKGLRLFAVPPRGTTGQILGKHAATKLHTKLYKYEAPIDILLQEVNIHNVRIYNTAKTYVTHCDDLVGGTTIQNKKLIKFKKIIREVKRPFWQFSSLITYKVLRVMNNYKYYKENLPHMNEADR